MKKLFALILACAFLLSFAACGDGEESSFAEMVSSQAEQSKEESKPWYDTSVPDSYSSQAPDYSDAESSLVPDVSKPNEQSSVPEVSMPESNTAGYDSLAFGWGYEFTKNAVGYRIAFTKQSPVNATYCITNVGSEVTAVYDGTITRFFGAVDGTYYCALYGKYLYPCCNGAFLSGDLNAYNSDNAVRIEFDEDTQAYVSVKEQSGAHAHGSADNTLSFYSSVDKKSFDYSDGELMRHTEAQYAICRLYENGSVIENWNSGNLFTSEFSQKLGKYGVVKNNTVVIPFEYDLILTANDGENGVFLAIKDGRCYYISANGNIITPEGFDCGSQPFANRAWVFEDGQGWIIEFN